MYVLHNRVLFKKTFHLILGMFLGFTSQITPNKYGDYLRIRRGAGRIIVHFNSLTHA